MAERARPRATEASVVSQLRLESGWPRRSVGVISSTKGAGATEKWIARRRGTAYSTAPSAYTGELEREMEYFVEPEEAFTRDEIE